MGQCEETVELGRRTSQFQNANLVWSRQEEEKDKRRVLGEVEA
jgi:hypothetical protein